MLFYLNDKENIFKEIMREFWPAGHEEIVTVIYMKSILAHIT